LGIISLDVEVIEMGLQSYWQIVNMTGNLLQMIELTPRINNMESGCTGF